MAEQFTNAAETTLNGAINNAVTSLVVTSATGFPTSGTFRIRIDDEILTVTAVSGTTFTVTRASEAVNGVTTAASHSDGAAIRHVLTAGALQATVGLVLLEQHTASSSSSLDFTSFISSAYDDYVIRGIGVAPATNTASLLMEIGTGGGPTWDTGNNYEWVSFGYPSNGGVLQTNVGATGIAKIFNSMANNAGYGFGVFVLNASSLQSTSIRKTFHGTSQFVNSSPLSIFSTLGIQWVTSGTAATGIRFIMSSGNIASGTIRIYGVAK